MTDTGNGQGGWLERLGLADSSGVRSWALANASWITANAQASEPFSHFRAELVKRTTAELGNLMAERGISPEEGDWKQKLASAVEENGWWKDQLKVAHLVAVASGATTDANGLGVAGYGIQHPEMLLSMLTMVDTAFVTNEHNKGSEILARVLFGGSKLDDMPAAIEDAVIQGYKNSPMFGVSNLG